MARATRKFSDEERKTIGAAAQSVWNEIGYDVLLMVGEETGKGVNGATVSKAEVIEMVLDASRLEECIRDKALRERVAADIYGEKSEIEAFLKKDVFTYARYGM